MPYAILRFAKRKGGAITSIQKHNERQKEEYKSNPDIDPEKKARNYHIIEPSKPYKTEIDQRIREVGCATRKDSVRLIETMITASPEFLNPMPPDKQRLFFERAVEFMKREVGEKNILSAPVHMDEKTPHMRNVFEKVKIPSVEPEKREPLTEQQLALVNAHFLDHRMGVPVMLMLYAGLRRGELMALRWSDVDFEKRMIHVQEALAFEATNVGHRKAPKTTAGKRDVPILDNLYDALQQAKAQADSFLVCPTAEGTEMTNIAWRRAWESYMHHLNIAAGGKDASRSCPQVIAMQPFTAHQLRHTFITLCHEAGIDPKVTQEMAGHADIRTTLNIYTHLTKLKKDEAVQQLNSHVKERRKKLDAPEL